MAVGPGVSLHKVGDPVCVLVAGGGYAEYCAAHAEHCLPWPAGFSAAEAASLPETCFTVHHNLVERAHLAAGETVLIHGGSSGIGTTAIQVAKAWGATVITTAGSADKLAYCSALGADHVINYTEGDWEAAVRDVTKPRGVDVVLDMVAGDYLGREIECTAEDGRIAVIAVQGGTRSAIDCGLLLRKRIAVSGSTLRPRSIAYKTQLAQALRAKAWPWLESGKVKPVIHQVFPAAKAAEAHALMESSTHVGKIVLTWN